jgi:hypothetical protein
MRVIRIDTSLTALRDEVRTLFEMHWDLRERVETSSAGHQRHKTQQGREL